jgi:hypothetical protein
MRGLATGWAMILLLYTLTAAARKTGIPAEADQHSWSEADHDSCLIHSWRSKFLAKAISIPA